MCHDPRIITRDLRDKVFEALGVFFVYKGLTLVGWRFNVNCLSVDDVVAGLETGSSDSNDDDEDDADTTFNSYRTRPLSSNTS
jgi:hypothetical protein